MHDLFGRLFGFLLGSVAAGASVYYYILKEYRVSNELLTEDIYVGFQSWCCARNGRNANFNAQSLQSASQKLNKYIAELETRLDQLQKK